MCCTVSLQFLCLINDPDTRNLIELPKFGCGDADTVMNLIWRKFTAICRNK